jgi:D-alanyl-D-alanine dipeptidase
MAETLAAIGLAGNIIQFISFSSALVSKSREIHKAASGLSTELVDLNLVSADIQQFSAKLLANAQSSPQLCDIAMSCNAVATELEQAISAIQKQNHASHQGPKCIWKKEHIEGLKVRLESLRDQMSMHLISDTKAVVPRPLISTSLI